MALSVETLQQQLDDLDEAIATGVLVVKHGDTSVTYRSHDQLLAARSHIVDMLNKAQGRGPRRVSYVRQYGKAL
jgi:hypothetical protein